MLSPLDCHTAETGELVNGGRSPFILTVDMVGRLCYLIQKRPLNCTLNLTVCDLFQLLM